MEFPKRDQVTYKNLADVRIMMDLTIRGMNSVNTTASHLTQLGAPINCRSLVNLRSDARILAVLMLSHLENFRRLHGVQCERPDTCSLHNQETLEEYIQTTEGECIRIIRKLDEMSLKVELAGGVIDDPEIEIFEVTDLN